MRVRKFLLENERGQQFDMHNYKEGCLFTNPSELGYSYKSEFERLGDAFIESNRVIDKKDPTGIANFKSYDKCKEFIDFIELSEKLKFIYVIPFFDGDKAYYRDVSIREFQKTEKEIRRLACPLTFNGLSLWYEEKNFTYTIETQDSELRWDFEWDSKFSDYNIRNLSFINYGHVEAPFKIELDGEITSPIITILEDGEEVKKLDLTGLTIQENEKFIYSTRDTEQQIIRMRNNLETNLFDFLNPNFINFFKLRKGESTIRLEADGEITSGKITIYVQYKAV